MSKMKSAAMACIAISLLAGCGSTPVTPVVPAQVKSPEAKVTTPMAANKSTIATPVAATSIAAHLDPASALYRERSVYFDFDQYVLKPEAVRLLELHGKYLAAHPDIAIKIEGNADEQGGREYNLALGQKRAEVVLKALKLWGAKEGQMEAISFGEDKPKALGHDEASHAQNRRADLAYPLK